MQVGALFIFQNYQDQTTDTQIYEDELKLADLAEPLGYDSVWCVEHHFNNYSMGPDNTQFLSWVAGRTSTIKLGTGAVILPWWHRPLRIVEKITLLDHLSKGRTLFGMGRGLARREYEAFGVDMNEARGRFDECARMCVEGLESGFVEGSGPYFPQRRTEVRPRPYQSFQDRLYMVAMSPDSIPVCAEHGCRMMTFAQKPWEEMVDHMDTYRELFQKRQGKQAPPPVCVDFLACDEDPAVAEALARQHMSAYYLTVIEHYEFMSEHFKNTKGYGNYGDAVDVLREVGLEGAGNGFVEINTWGSPSQIIEKLERRRELIGDFDLVVQCKYGGLPMAAAQKSMRLFGEKVLPVIQGWR